MTLPPFDCCLCFFNVAVRFLKKSGSSTSCIRNERFRNVQTQFSTGLLSTLFWSIAVRNVWINDSTSPWHSRNFFLASIPAELTFLDKVKKKFPKVINCKLVMLLVRKNIYMVYKWHYLIIVTEIEIFWHNGFCCQAGWRKVDNHPIQSHEILTIMPHNNTGDGFDQAWCLQSSVGEWFASLTCSQRIARQAQIRTPSAANMLTASILIELSFYNLEKSNSIYKIFLCYPAHRIQCIWMTSQYLRTPVAFLKTVVQGSCAWNGDSPRFSQPEWGIITTFTNTARPSSMMGFFRSWKVKHFQKIKNK